MDQGIVYGLETPPYPVHSYVLSVSPGQNDPIIVGKQELLQPRARLHRVSPFGGKIDSSGGRNVEENGPPIRIIIKRLGCRCV